MERVKATPPAYWIMAGFLAIVLLLLGNYGARIGYETFFNGPAVAQLYVVFDRLSIFLIALAPIAALWSMRLGLAMTMVLPAMFFGLPGHQWYAVSSLGALAVGMCASWAHPRRYWVTLAFALLPIAFIVFVGGHLVAPDGADNTFVGQSFNPPGYQLLSFLMFTVGFAIPLGLAWLIRRLVAKGEAGRRALARAGEVEEQAAVVGERARLARDLHDVVAHHVSLIAVRAETAPYTHADLGDTAKSVLTDIASDARLALDELRGVLGILGRAGEGERSPQPAWSDIPALVERTRAAGLEVTLEGDSAATVSPGVGYAAYRVVQEGLTNARKHAPGAPVRVTLEAGDRLVHVEIRNPSSGTMNAGGRGLVGMKERVAALGGRMTAGPVNGEYVVDVTLPVVAS